MPKDIDKYFFNREKDIEKISIYLSMLERDIPNQLLITGYRGVGKTFLLKKIMQDQPKNFLRTYIDISEFYSRHGGELTEEKLMKEILNSINNTLLQDETQYNKIKGTLINLVKGLKFKNYDFKNGSHIFDFPIPEIKDNYSELSKFVMELPQKIVDSSQDIDGYIIVIDEFQLLKYLRNPEAFFWLVRSFSQKQFNVSYIFTGSVSKTSEIINMINGQNGAFGGRMIQINVDPFSKEETIKYIDEKSGGVKFTEEGFERFYSCTRGIPAYINSLCSILPNNIQCDGDLIKEILKLNIDQVAIMWIYVWGRLNTIEKQIIIAILENKEISLMELSNILGFSRVTIYKHIDSLNNQGIIEFTIDKKYVIAEKMLSFWLNTKYENDGIYPL